ncbi:hypothetical protein GW17_00018778 [Ensete ventricosum]|nr:hypothetical protein GW17_00018778 [Ensete ventricosum]
MVIDDDDTVGPHCCLRLMSFDNCTSVDANAERHEMSDNEREALILNMQLQKNHILLQVSLSTSLACEKRVKPIKIRNDISAVFAN